MSEDMVWPNRTSQKKIEASVESVFDTGIIVSYTDTEKNITYVGALIQQQPEATKMCFPSFRPTSYRKKPHQKLTDSPHLIKIVSHYDNKPGSATKKKHTKKKFVVTKKTSIEHSISLHCASTAIKSTKSCIVVCDDPQYKNALSAQNHVQRSDDKFHRKSKSQAYERLQAQRKADQQIEYLIESSSKKKDRIKQLFVPKQSDGSEHPASSQSDRGPLNRNIGQFLKGPKRSLSTFFNQQQTDLRPVIMKTKGVVNLPVPLCTKSFSLSLTKLPLTVRSST